MNRAWFLLALAGCPHAPVRAKPILADPIASIDGDPVQAMKAELADQILTSYDRDDPPDLETQMISRAIGAARIGVNPDDVLIARDDLAHAASRWPRFFGRGGALEARSKRLAIELATDHSAAWVSDEISWRIPACGRTAVVPIRMTALYAHDGDRWVLVVEHLSFARPPAVDPEGLIGRPFPSASLDRDLSDTLSHAVARAPGFVAADATLIGPAPNDLWTGADAALAIPTLISEDRRIGLVGRQADSATVAYWVGNFTTDGLGGKVRLRGTFVFERRAHGLQAVTRWVLVQAHVSEAIRDRDLAATVFGVSLVTPYVPDQPVSLRCD